MPCYDPQQDEDDARIRQDLDERTAMLCEAMNLLKEMGLFYRCSSRLRQWFRTHAEFDRTRSKDHTNCHAMKTWCRTCPRGSGQGKTATHLAGKAKLPLCCRCYDIWKKE